MQGCNMTDKKTEFAVQFLKRDLKDEQMVLCEKFANMTIEEQ